MDSVILSVFLYYEREDLFDTGFPITLYKYISFAYFRYRPTKNTFPTILLQLFSEEDYKQERRLSDTLAGTGRGTNIHNLPLPCQAEP